MLSSVKKGIDTLTEKIKSNEDLNSMLQSLLIRDLEKIIFDIELFEYYGKKGN